MFSQLYVILVSSNGSSETGGVGVPAAFFLTSSKKTGTYARIFQCLRNQLTLIDANYSGPEKFLCDFEKVKS